MTTTTKLLLGKKDIEHFLYLSVTITTIYRDIAEQPKPPTLKHASRKTMSVSEALADIAQWSFSLHFVTFICNHTNFERSEASVRVPFTLKNYEGFHQYRCPKKQGFRVID